MEPLHDSNVIYNFHFYEPFLFTHQGALDEPGDTWRNRIILGVREVQLV